jgi:urease accessory protein
MRPLITREVIPPAPPFAAGCLAPGHGALSVELVGGRSVVTRRHAASPLRLLCPKNAGCAAWTYTSTFGGGLVDGDDVRLTVDVGPGAQALVATQASTKAYAGPRGVRQTTTAAVAADAALVLLSDPLVPFAGARLDALVEIDLADGATLALVEGITAGRVANGERWAAARCQTRVRVRRAGALVLDDALLLDPAHGDVPTRMGPFDAWATVVLAGPGVREAAAALLAQARPRHHMTDAVSQIELAAAVDDGCLLRIAARSTAILSLRVREALVCVGPLLGDDPFTRRW